MDYKLVTQEPIVIIGIEVRTTNENGKAIADIGNLWGRFYSEGIVGRIPNKVSEEIISLYTDYEKDYTKPYTNILGCKVSSLDEIPEGMTAKIIPAATYKVYTAKGKLPDAVVGVWQYVWKNDSELHRTYTGDFEVYGEKAQNPANAEVDIYVAVE